MGKKDLQCLFIGGQSSIYDDLLVALKSFGLNFQAKLVSADEKNISRELKKLKMASLIFISDEVVFSVETLSDLVWQYASDSIIVIVTQKTASTTLKKPFNNTHFSKLHFDKDKKSTCLHLQYLIDSVQNKWDFRRCKRLLGVSEKRCQWLVDSSNEAIAFVSRDLHLYANASYLGLFGINSVHELPALPIAELIVDDEYHLFKDFVKKQITRHDMNRSLVLSLMKANGKIFRAKIHAIPSVFKGRKCLQLWVHPLDKYKESQLNEEELAIVKQGEKISQGSTPKARVLKKKKPTVASILKGVIKRKEAVILAHTLVDMKVNEYKHNEKIENHMLSLKVPVAQRVGIDDLLLEASGIDLAKNRQVFWDKVKLTRVLQVLIKKKRLDANLFIRLSEASLFDKSFEEWFLPIINKLGGNKASHLVFLLPSEVRQNQLFVKNVKAIQKVGCHIALDNFSVSEKSLQLLKHMKPEYVRLSLEWVKRIEGQSKRELALGSFIRQIEAKKIKVIAPCGFSVDMRRLFALSGASFCQERALKAA